MSELNGGADVHGDSVRLRNFGSETADRDSAREDSGESLEEGVFVNTVAAKKYFNSVPPFRCIAGSMGSGKSLLLFKAAVEVSKQIGRLTAPRQDGAAFTPSAEFANVVAHTHGWRFGQRGEDRVTQWTQLWEWALLNTVMLRYRDHAEGTESGARRHLPTLNALCAGARFADPFKSIAVVLESFEGRPNANRLPLPSTAALEEFLQDHANEFPPLDVFIDNQDQFYMTAPDFWTVSTMGCFFAINQLEARSRGRVHCAQTIRPEALMLLNGHPEEGRLGSSVLRVRWETEELIEIFRRRAARLADDLLRDPDSRTSNPLLAFFGASFERDGDLWIENHGAARSSPIAERVMMYILRHTLGRPREVIIAGNCIIDERERRSASSHVDESQIVRDAVASAASVIASAYLGEIGHRWPWRLGTETGPDAIRLFLAHYVHENVITATRARVSEADYLRTARVVETGTGHDDQYGPLDILASLGLIGYPTKHTDGAGYVQHFGRPGQPQRRVIPADVRLLLVHPILCDPQLHIQSVKGTIVGPHHVWNGDFSLPSGA